MSVEQPVQIPQAPMFVDSLYAIATGPSAEQRSAAR